MSDINCEDGNSRKRRYPCPCDDCRHSPYCMQTRHMIKKHMNLQEERRTQAAMDARRAVRRQGGLVLEGPDLRGLGAAKDELEPEATAGVSGEPTDDEEDNDNEDNAMLADLEGDLALPGDDSGVELDYDDFGLDYSGEASPAPSPSSDRGNYVSGRSSGSVSQDSNSSGRRIQEQDGRRYAARAEDASDDEDRDGNQDRDQQEEEEEDPDMIEVPAGDPLYARMEQLFAQEPDLDATDSDATGQVPRAFSEDPIIRHTYIRAFAAAAFQGATHELVHNMLDSDFKHFTFLQSRYGFQIPGLKNMARTLATVERRLGLDPDEHITYYFHCNLCWHRHHPSELYRLAHQECLQEGCSGRLYKTKTLSDGKTTRIPLKILPTLSLRRALQWILMRPGKLKELNAWRREGEDEAGEVPPQPQEDWPGTHDSAFRMFDMQDGWGWRAIRAGLERRRRGGQWTVEDIDVHERNQRFVALPTGLVLQFNMDWSVLMCHRLRLMLTCSLSHAHRFRAYKRGKYSVGAIYCTVCNNPRSKRFLREETILLAIIPGPDEPSLEALNPVLEVFALEAKELYQGALILQYCVMLFLTLLIQVSQCTYPTTRPRSSCTHMYTSMSLIFPPVGRHRVCVVSPRNISCAQCARRPFRASSTTNAMMIQVRTTSLTRSNGN